VLEIGVRLHLLGTWLAGKVNRVFGDESGTTVAEYALVLVLVSVAVIGVLTTLGTTLKDKIMAIVTKLGGVNP
jgi:Flp pilus assembly pilin Flp